MIVAPSVSQAGYPVEFSLDVFWPMIARCVVAADRMTSNAVQAQRGIYAQCDQIVISPGIYDARVDRTHLA